jgi:molybdate transport system permease protein
LVFTFVVGTMLIVPPAAVADEAEEANEAEEAGLTLDANGSAAALEGVSFAIDDFARNNKGTSRAFEGRDIGYRYPLVSQTAFAAVAFEDEFVVYIPEQISSSFGLDFTSNAEIQGHLLTMLRALDEANANGGTTIKQLDLPVTFTRSATIKHDRCVIRFGEEVEPGYYYAIITLDPDAATGSSATVNSSTSAPQPDLSKQALFIETGNLVQTGDLAIQAAPEGWDALWDCLTNMDYRPFWVSLRTSLVALVFVFILGLAAARLTLKVSARAKDILDAIFTIPMVLPPTVIGFLLLVMFGNSTPLGRWLIEHGIQLVFTWPAAVMAATVVAFPLMYRTVRGAFEAQDQDMLDAARTLGWGEGRIFTRLMMPLAWPSIAAGTVLAFARAMGEFGATLFVAGTFAGVTETMPIAIYFQWMGGNTSVATFWVFVVIVFSFIVILFINLYARHTQKYRQGGAVRSGRGLDDAPQDGTERAIGKGASGEH